MENRTGQHKTEEYPYPTGNEYPYPPKSLHHNANQNSSSTVYPVFPENNRGHNRTPSPTPSELKELQSGAIDWKSLTKWRFWIRREWIWYYPLFIIILVITALVSIYHKQIVHWLTPLTKELQSLKFGWLVPIGILFVISFPPLFGHEIVAILCGLVWGLGAGFGIVAAGTFLGEVGNFYAFKYCCRARGEKMERSQISYACLARVVREGGFKIALIARLSAVPGHFTTAVFSTCGMGIIVFSIAAILSLPKQFITVYLGVILKQSESGTEDTKSRIISGVVLAVSLLITLVAMWYIFRQMNKVKPQIIYERRKARQAKLERYGTASQASESITAFSSSSFNPNESDPEVPLKAKNEDLYQRWDAHGRAVGYAGDPTLIYQPQPNRALSTFVGESTDYAKGARNGYSQAPQDSAEDLTNAIPLHTPNPYETNYNDNAPLSQQNVFPVRSPQFSPQRLPIQPYSLPHSERTSNQVPYPSSPPGIGSGLAPQSTHFPNPFESAHDREATDASYRTAMTASPIEGLELTGRERVSKPTSPSPPTFRTASR